MISDAPRKEPTAAQAIEEANETYIRMAKDEHRAGREIPAVGVPRSLGNIAVTSVEATQTLYRKSLSRSFTVPFLPWKKIITEALFEAPEADA